MQFCAREGRDLTNTISECLLPTIGFVSESASSASNSLTKYKLPDDSDSWIPVAIGEPDASSALSSVSDSARKLKTAVMNLQKQASKVTGFAEERMDYGKHDSVFAVRNEHSIHLIRTKLYYDGNLYLIKSSTACLFTSST